MKKFYLFLCLLLLPLASLAQKTCVTKSTLIGDVWVSVFESQLLEVTRAVGNGGYEIVVSCRYKPLPLMCILEEMCKIDPLLNCIVAHDPAFEQVEKKLPPGSFHGFQIIVSKDGGLAIFFTGLQNFRA